MDCNMPGFFVLAYLQEFTPIHVHLVSIAIQPSYPLLPSSLSALSLSQQEGLFHEVALHIRWPKYQSFNFSIIPSNGYSVLISFRIECFGLLVVLGTLKSLL